MTGNNAPLISFGPAVHHEPDGSFIAVCTYCHFRIFTTCTHVKPSRELPDRGVETPDWCEMKSGMLRDAEEAAMKESSNDS